MTEWAIETEGLGRRFGHQWAVCDLGLRVPRGSVFGILGPNGAGKSTTIHMLMGLLPPTAGRMEVLGMNPVREDVSVRKRVGYVSEVHGFYESMRLDEMIGLVAAYHSDWDWEKCRSLMEEFGLKEGVKVKTLSRGMRAKLALLLALSFDPEMLILDEPTGGLDPAARRSFIETILGRYQESGKTILLSSHLMNEFSGLLDYVAFLKEGRLQIVSPLEDLHRRTKRVRLVFDGPVPADFHVPGAVIIRRNGREAMVTVKEFDPERTPEELRGRAGAKDIRIEEMTLEDIFVDLVAT